MSKQTRRDFLEASLLSAAAAAAAGTARPSASQAADDAAAGQSSSPNEKLRVATLGVRGRGGEHLEGFGRRNDCEIVAIVDPDEATGQAKGVDVIEKASGKRPAYYKDMREAFEKSKIDIVTIATPNHWHSLAAIWAIQAGKDVYVEKPVSHNVSEGRRVVQAARKHEKIVQTGTQCRSMQGTIDAIEFMKSGGIGEVSLARGLCYKKRDSIGPRGIYEVPSSVDYNIWLGPAPEASLTRPRLHYDWHWQWDYGNGDLGNQGIHQMDIARWGLGVTDVGQSVLSYGGRLGYEDAGETANTQVSIHDYGDKQLVFEVRGLQTPDLLGAKVGVIFYGTKGYVALTSYEGGAAFDPDGNVVKTFKAGGDHVDNFIKAVRSRKHEELHADIEQGHLSSALCHLGNVSYRLGEDLTGDQVAERLSGNTEAKSTFDRVIEHLNANNVDLAHTKLRFGARLQIDSAAEQFTGEMAPAANEMLSREYRAPFVVPEETDV